MKPARPLQSPAVDLLGADLPGSRSGSGVVFALFGGDDEVVADVVERVDLSCDGEVAGQLIRQHGKRGVQAPVAPVAERRFAGRELGELGDDAALAEFLFDHERLVVSQAGDDLHAAVRGWLPTVLERVEIVDHQERQETVTPAGEHLEERMLR